MTSLSHRAAFALVASLWSYTRSVCVAETHNSNTHTHTHHTYPHEDRSKLGFRRGGVVEAQEGKRVCARRRQDPSSRQSLCMGAVPGGYIGHQNVQNTQLCFLYLRSPKVLEPPSKANPPTHLHPACARSAAIHHPASRPNPSRTSIQSACSTPATCQRWHAVSHPMQLCGRVLMLV